MERDDDWGEAPELTQETVALLSNGLDFLNKAREELQAGQAKFSIVSFWTAVEILIKVPLVHEHWTLVCSGKKLERKKYRDGNFQSVSYDEACARLGDVLGMPLSKETANLFANIKNHRNRVVHFYHNELGEGDQMQVMTEQADAWFALNRLMRDDWASLFGSTLRNKMATDETRMLRSSEFYAGAKLRHETVQEKLAIARKQNCGVSQCTVCFQQSVIHHQIIPDMPLYEDECCVCHDITPRIDVTCPDCHAVNTIIAGGEDFCCGNCGCLRKRYDAINPVITTKDNMDGPVPAGCSDCEKHDTVCEFADAYLCTDCLTLYDSLEMCDHCTYHSSSVPDLSSAFGCSFCPGHRDTWDDD